jgi:ferredoxin
MAIKRVWIERGCIACHQSVNHCPDVFHVRPTGARVRDGVDCSRYEEEIRQAAAACPVQVIKFEEN